MKKCLVCGSELLKEPLLDFNNMPESAQNIPNEEEIKQDKGIRLKLYQCKGCGLVQFDCKPVDYYRDVIRSGGFSSTMVELRKSQYRHLIESYHLENKKFIEVGCGQGEFLSVLTEFPVDAYGVEHKHDLVEIARKRGLNVSEAFVENKNTVIENGPFDVFLSFNFLEHQPDPNGMLQGIYENLKEDGMGLITVPSLEYILEYNGYYELIRDHLVYYTFDTLQFVLEKNGFEVLEQEMVNRDTLSVIVLAATAKLTKKIEYIIDSAPFKQGKYAPASHIPIISPADALLHSVDAIIIMAPGYTDEIAAIIKRDFGQGTEIAVMKAKNLQMYEDIKQ